MLPLAAETIPAAPVLGLMTLGIVVAIFGHIVHERRIVAVGVAVLFVATVLMMVLAFAAYQGDEIDPRPGRDPSDPTL